MTTDRTGTVWGPQVISMSTIFPLAPAPLDFEGMLWRKLAENFVGWQLDVEDLATGQQPGNC